MSPLDIPLAILTVAFALCLVRIGRGPTLADRVVGGELAFVITLAVFALLAARDESTHILTVALVASLVQFIATASLAYLLLHKAQQAEDER